ncbi:MAG: DNA-3-methyladenine glycosylase [Candidatus Omnitrophica bacterium]|nr:DNA-3-methyladenine glycosylase [Candidatus Omnitrophota bacterium]
MRPLERPFYERNTQVVAIELIGKVLTLHQNGTAISGVIVETEAYFGSGDPASHAYRGVTPRNRVMFGPAGVSYVYFTYGNHHCLNIVTEREDTAGAVLIRALEPISGMDVMRKRRPNAQDQELTNGPGKLTQAFGITREHSGVDLTKSSFFVAEGTDSRYLRIQAAPRIGISRAKEKVLRFYLMDNPFVSTL